MISFLLSVLFAVSCSSFFFCFLCLKNERLFRYVFTFVDNRLSHFPSFLNLRPLASRWALPTTVPSLPVPLDELAGYVSGWFDGIAAGCIPVPLYTVQCFPPFDDVTDNSVYDVVVCAVPILTRVVIVYLVCVSNVLFSFSFCFLCACTVVFVYLTGHMVKVQGLVLTLDYRYFVNTNSVKDAVFVDSESFRMDFHYLPWSGYLQ